MPNKIKVRYDGVKVVEVDAPASVSGRTCGICGNFDHEDNDMAMGPHVRNNGPMCLGLAPNGTVGEQVSHKMFISWLRKSTVMQWIFMLCAHPWINYVICLQANSVFDFGNSWLFSDESEQSDKYCHEECTMGLTLLPWSIYTELDDVKQTNPDY